MQNYTRDISVDPLKNSESFKYKTSITGKTANDGNAKEVEFSVSLNHLSNFWKTLDIPLINCEVSLSLTCSKYCVIADADPNANPLVLEIRVPAGATFEIEDTKPYAPVITLSTEDDNILLEQIIGQKFKLFNWFNI